MQPVLLVVITALLTAVIVAVAMNLYQKNVATKQVGSAEEKARAIIDEALKSAEETKREMLLKK